MASINAVSERWQKMLTLFNDALRIDQPRRGGYLDRECGSDDELREELKKLLDAFESGTEAIEMTIEQAAESFVGQLPEVSRASLVGTSGKTSGDYHVRRLREAFACIETFFYHSARSRQDSGDVASALALAELFGEAARGEIFPPTAEGLRALSEQVPADEQNDAMAAALRRWLVTISASRFDDDAF